MRFANWSIFVGAACFIWLTYIFADPCNRATCPRIGRDELYPRGIINMPMCEHRCPIEGQQYMAPPNPPVRPSGDNRAFILIEPMVYEVGSTGIKIVVPAGFVTDYASIPSQLWSLYSPHDRYSRAAIVHDYLYWSQLCTRQQADNLFMIAMKESDVPPVTRNNIYLAVSTLGALAWNNNIQERLNKMPKVVPVYRRDFPPNWTWERYREKLVANRVSDPIFSDNKYCALGESTEVPTKISGRNETRKKVLTAKMVQRPAIEF